MKKLIFALSVFTSLAHAQINFQDLTYSGTGCPQGTVSSVTSPDGATLTILFDEFRAEVPQYAGSNDNIDTRGSRSQRNNPALSHKNCNLGFTADLPPGVMLESLSVAMDARGATILDEGVQGFFASILVGYQGLASSRGNPTVLISKNWRNPRHRGVFDDWIAQPRKEIPINSACSGARGRTIRFDLKNHVNAEIMDGDVSKSGIISVDSADVSGLLKITLLTQRCGGNLPPRRY